MGARKGSRSHETIAHFDAMAGRYAALYGARNPVGYAFSVRRRRVLELFDTPGGKVLDVGCGPGVMAEALLAQGCTFWGVDPAPQMVEEAKEALAGAPGAQFSVGVAERLDFPDGSFDTVLCMGVIERLEDDDAGLREMVRVLRPGGSLIVTMPNLSSPGLFWRDECFYRLVALARAARRRLAGRDPGPAVRGHRRYSRRGYAGLLARHGCEVADVDYCVYSPFLAPLDAVLPGPATTAMAALEGLHRTPLRVLGAAMIVKARKPPLADGRG